MVYLLMKKVPHKTINIKRGVATLEVALQEIVKQIEEIGCVVPLFFLSAVMIVMWRALYIYKVILQ